MSGNEKLDRELESFLAEENSRVAELYRKLPRQEPDAKLDAAVIAMARSAVAPKRTRNYWMPGLSAAAIALLVVGVSYRTALKQWNERATLPSQTAISEPAPPPTPQAQAFPVAPAPEQPPSASSNDAVSIAPAPVAATPMSDTLARRKAADVQRAPAPPSRQAVAPPAASTVMEKRADKSANVAPLPPQRSEAPLQQLDAAIPAPTESAKQTGGAGVSGRASTEQPSRKTESAPEELKSANAPGAFAPAPAPAAMRNASNNHLYPEHWIAIIQQLLRDNQRDEAIRNLGEFRKQYPDYRLPDDLRNLK